MIFIDRRGKNGDVKSALQAAAQCALKTVRSREPAPFQKI